MTPAFHLSLAVQSLSESIDFYTRLLNAKVLHRDPSGYVNLDFYGIQITLKENPRVKVDLPDFHFGINLSLSDFETSWKWIAQNGREYVETEPEVWDAGTSMERKKIYLKCPSGYLLEIKGYASR